MLFPDNPGFLVVHVIPSAEVKNLLLFPTAVEILPVILPIVPVILLVDILLKEDEDPSASILVVYVVSFWVEINVPVLLAIKRVLKNPDSTKLLINLELAITDIAGIYYSTLLYYSTLFFKQI